uniref:hypothetical protein n=1 Tax=uncultured Pseudoalteromonas sp. TaxID=114053 RepID=UPI0032B29B75
SAFSFQLSAFSFQLSAFSCQFGVEQCGLYAYLVGGTLVPKCLEQFTAKAVSTNLKTFTQRELNEKRKRKAKSTPS